MSITKKLAFGVKTIIFAMLTVSIASCSDFLEPRSPSEFTPSTVEHLHEMLVMGHPGPSAAGGAAGIHLPSLTGGFLDIMSDDVEFTDRFIPPQNPVADTWYIESYARALFAYFTWQPNYSRLITEAGYRQRAADVYRAIYHRLIYINSVFDHIDRVEGPDTERMYVRAQALALRAFFFLNLVNIFGEPYTLNPDGLGVPIRTTGAKENRPMTRNTVREVYDLIISDLTEAVELFETLPAHFQFQIQRHRANMPMAMLLLARTHLFRENWDEAAHYSQRLINEWGNRFQIRDLSALRVSNVHPDAATTTDPNLRRAQIFDANFLTRDNPDVMWLFGSANDMTSFTAQDFFQMNPRVQRNETRGHLTLASRSLINSFDANDLRLRINFVRSLFHEPDYNVNTFNPALMRFRAFGKLPITSDAYGVPNLQGNRFLPRTGDHDFGQALRFTEAYLILAEAQAMRGQSGEALQTLQHIWRNRFADGVAPASYTTGDIVQVVRNERRRELALEALRWFDLRRWDRPRIERTWMDANGIFRQFVLEENDPGYTLPLPHTLMEGDSGNFHLEQVPLFNNGNPRQPL